MTFAEGRPTILSVFRRRRLEKAAKRIADARIAMADVAARGAIAFAAEGTPSREELRLQYEQGSDDDLRGLLQANERGLELYMSERGLTSGDAVFDPIAAGIMERIHVLIRMLAERFGQAGHPDGPPN